MTPSRALATVALVLTACGVVAGCTEEKDGQAIKASDVATSVPDVSAEPVDPVDPSEPDSGGLAECTDGTCTAEFTEGDSLDFESGVGLADLEVEEISDGAIRFTAHGEPGASGGGVICSGGCSVSSRSSSGSSTIEITAREGANIILSGFPMQVLEVSGGTATVRMGG